MTDDEYNRIVSNAHPKTVSEWARAILVHASEPIDMELLLLAEFLALRTIILNFHFSLADGGRTPSMEATKALVDRADAEKVDRAQRRIAELGGAAHAASRWPSDGERR